MQYPKFAFTRQSPFVAVTSSGRQSAETQRSPINQQINGPQDLKYNERHDKKTFQLDRKSNHNDAQILESSIHGYKRSSRYRPTVDDEHSTSSIAPKKESLPIHIEKQYYKSSAVESNQHDASSSKKSRNSVSNRLLRIPMSLSLQHDSQTYDAVPIKTFIDTGAQTTVMTFDAAKRAGIAHLIDRRYAGHASGVAGVSCRVLGRIPANSVTFIMGEADDEIDTSPSIAILEDRILDGEAVDMLLGLDVLEEWQAMICLRDRVLTVRNGRRRLKGKEIIIPFENSSTKKSIGNVHNANANYSDSHGRASYNNDRKMKQHTKQHRLSNDTPDVKPRDQLYSQRSNPFTRDSSLLKSELDALDERSRGRPMMNIDTSNQKSNRYSQHQGMEDDLVGDEDDSDSYYSESDEDFDDCDLSGV
jgi:hypothetical protein